jgi:nicotinamidase-related amidase
MKPKVAPTASQPIRSSYEAKMAKALLVIDIQNDYFPGGKYPLWKPDVVLQNVEQAIERAKAQGIPIVHVQHVTDSSGPFFNKGTGGAEIHPRIRAAAPDSPVIIKEHADSFEKTNLEEMLSKLGVDELLVCGMMTHNCVTHTSISKAAEKYNVAVLADCCTTIDEMTHHLALHALSTRVKLVPADEALQPN